MSKVPFPTAEHKSRNLITIGKLENTQEGLHDSTPQLANPNPKPERGPCFVAQATASRLRRRPGPGFVPKRPTVILAFGASYYPKHPLEKPNKISITDFP